MKKYNNLAMFGGTFSPFHNGHLAVLKAYAETVCPDAVYIVPTATPPHKLRDDSATDKQRLEMINLATETLSLDCEVVVSDIEILRGGKSYTVDTVEQLSTVAENIYIYCGTDMVLTLDKWYNHEKLLSMISVAYMQREEDLRYDCALKEKVAELNSLYKTKFISLPKISAEISSSMIRNAVEEKRDISSMVPARVAEYIYAQGLYVKKEV